MRPIFFTLPAVFALTACIEVDMTLEVLGEDEAQVTGFIQIERQFYDMSGGDDSFCEAEDGGELVLTDTHARCEFDRVGSFEEIMRPDSASDAPTELEGELVDLGDGRVRALLPLGGMTSEMDEMQQDEEMMAMMRAMMSGVTISFTVAGREIESSTGTISEDGTSASVSLDVNDLFAPADARPGDFETVVRY